MKLTKELLNKKSKRPLHLVKFLNLSGLDVAVLDNLDACGVLHWLIASDNKLQTDDGLENLKQLWYLDLSNNHITMLGTLSRYLALGTLILTNNNLKWVDLEKIRHAHLLSISLHGNPCLDSDPYYRIHVIDCLPLIWELDGRLVTVTERLHVRQFFIDTELSQHPVRHKMGKTFRTTTIKNIGTEGIVSKKCKYIYSKFPMSETHTKHTDERRLAYLTHMVQEDILQWCQHSETGGSTKPNIADNFLDNLFEQRHLDVERCNMVLLLLVISLEYQLPTALVRSVLNSAHIDMIGSVSTMPFFLLPPQHRTRVICVLLNAAKVERDNNVGNTRGLYPQLFMCLYYTVSQLTRISQTSMKNMHTIKPIHMNSDYKALMASEVVSLMLNVNRYFTCLASDIGVINLTVSATGDPQIVVLCQEQLHKSETIFSNISVKAAQKKVKEIIIRAINERLDKINTKMSDIPIGDRYLSLSDSLPIKPLHSVIWASQFLVNGQCVPKLDPPILNPVKEAAKPKPQQPKIGDKILLGPQVVGDLAMILEGEIGMIKVDTVPLSNGAMQSRLKDSDGHYTYVDLRALCFARDINMWRSINTTGDVYTVHSVDQNELVAITRKETLKNESNKVQPVVYTPRTKTMIVYDKGATRGSTQRRSSSLVMEKRMVHTLSGRTPQATKTADSNKSCSVASRDFPDFSFQEGNYNQNAHAEVLAIMREDVPYCDDNIPPTSGQTDQKDFPRTATGAHISDVSEKTICLDYTVPVPSRSSSPTVRSRNCPEHDDEPETLETDMAHDDDEPEKELNESSDLEGDEASKQKDMSCQSLADHNRKQDQEHHQDKDRFEDLTTQATHFDQDQNHFMATDPSIRVIWAGQEHSPESHENLTVKVTLPGQYSDDTLPDSMPLADAWSTFLTSVSGQGEGLRTVQLNSKTTDSKTDSKIRQQNNAGTAFNRTATTENVDSNFSSSLKVTKRPAVSKPMGPVRVKFGNQRPFSGEPQSGTSISHMGRNPPHSAVGEVNSRLITFINGNAVFKSNFQQQREGIWKGATRHEKPWLIAGNAQRSSSSCPTPQRPTSPVSKTFVRIPGLKVTHTDTWLGGGHDLYWEDVRQRPKSGHIPGWKEGLPESMRRQRSKSAFASSTRSQFGYTPSAASSVGFKTAGPAYSDHAGLNAEDGLKVTNLMPHSHQLHRHQPSSLCSTTSEDGHILPTLGPNIDHRSTFYLQEVKVSTRPFRNPSEDSSGFTIPQAENSGYHFVSDILDHEFTHFTTYDGSSPVQKLQKTQNKQHHINQSGSAEVTDPGISGKMALPGNHLDSARMKNLQPMILKSIPKGSHSRALSAPFGTVKSLETFEKTGSIPQSNFETSDETTSKLSTNKDICEDFTNAPDHYEHLDMGKLAIQDNANDRFQDVDSAGDGKHDESRKTKSLKAVLHVFLHDGATVEDGTEEGAY